MPNFTMVGSGVSLWSPVNNIVNVGNFENIIAPMYSMLIKNRWVLWVYLY